MTSVRRLIGLLFVLAYYFQFLFRSMMSHQPTGASMPGMPGFTLPPADVVDAIVFGLFAAFSLILGLGMLAPRGGFRPADVDVLFATPVSPKIVLGFRIVRDYLATLILPILLTLLSGRGAVVSYQFFYKEMPSQSRYVGMAFSAAWLLMSLMWVCLGYGFSGSVNRSDEQSDVNKKVLTIAGFAVTTLTAIYIALMLSRDFSIDSLTRLAHSPVLRIVFFPASCATSMVMGVFGGNYIIAASGAAMMLFLSVLGIWIAMAQAGYMYDQAAARGFDSLNLRKLQRSGDTYGMVAERARQGKVKMGRIAGRIARINTRGPATLVWKELLLQTRGAMFQHYLFALIMLSMVLVPLWSARRSTTARATSVEGLMLIGIEAMVVFMIAMSSAQGGFIELLRRVDIQKPLPFSPSTTVFWEVAAKVFPTAIIVSVTSLAATLIDPSLYQVALASIFLLPSLSLILTSVVLLVTILFPDVDDATQRSFRGLMVLLGCAITTTPGAGIFLTLYLWLHAYPLLAALPAVGANVGIAVGVSMISGGLYAQFNPSE